SMGGSAARRHQAHATYARRFQRRSYSEASRSAAMKQEFMSLNDAVEEHVTAPPLQPKLANGNGAAATTAPRAPWTVPAMQWRDPATIPIRKFLYGYCYARGFVSATIADSGMGKSSLKIAEFLACATGLPLLGITPTERVRVLYWNGDDPYEEVERRIHAVCQHYDIDLERLLRERWLYIGTRKDHPLCLAGVNGRSVAVDQDAVADVCSFIKDNEIGLACFDPLKSVHRVPENSNDDMDVIGDIFNVMAEDT